MQQLTPQNETHLYDDQEPNRCEDCGYEELSYVTNYVCPNCKRGCMCRTA